MVNSIFFVISALVGVSGFYFYPKNKVGHLDGVNWFCISIILWMCFNVFIAAFINLIHIPINLFSMGIIDLGAGLFFWFINIRNKQTQKYSITLIDILFIFILIIMVYFLGRWQFGPTLHIRYETSDPSMHFQYAREIIISQKVSGMFFSPLIDAILLEIITPFINIVKLYKALILIDMVMLALSGMVFFITINRYLNNLFMKITGMIAVLAYVLGYPFNNMIFGFFYLGLGVTLICSLFFLLDCFIKNEIEKNQNAILLGLVTLGIMLCYTLFAPVIYIAAFLCLIIYFRAKEQLFSLSAIKNVALILLIPGLLGMYYAYFNYFAEAGVQPNQAIQFEGYIYRDLFSNFVIILPFAIFGSVKMIKNRDINAALIATPLLWCFMIVLLVGGLNGKVSSYYYYKNYYLLWMIVFYLLIYGLHFLSKYSKGLILIYFSVWAVIAGINLTGLEIKINEKNINFDPVIKSSTFFDIYNFNKLILDIRPFYDNNKLELYNYVYSLLVKGEDSKSRIPFAGDWLDCYWYEAITSQIGDTSHYWMIGEDTFMNDWENGKFGNYILVLYDGELYAKYKDYFEQLEKIYQNSSGFVAMNK